MVRPSKRYSGAIRLQRKRTTKEHLQKRSGEENVNSWRKMEAQRKTELDGDKSQVVTQWSVLQM